MQSYFVFFLCQAKIFSTLIEVVAVEDIGKFLILVGKVTTKENNLKFSISFKWKIGQVSGTVCGTPDTHYAPQYYTIVYDTVISILRAFW